ncbi:MAG: hypothetical protein V3R86_08130 [Candidatus Hydrothermarchaeaceae archaeon]
MRKVLAFVGAILLIAGISGYVTGSQGQATWVLRGSDAIIIGGYGDNFDYGGVNTRDIAGDAKVQVNAYGDVGSVIAKVQGTINPESGVTLDGEIKIVMNHFSGMMPFQEGGIADDVTIHGDTGRGPPVMPKIQTFLGGWGTADVYLDDVLIYDDLDAHFMYTDGARQDDYHVHSADQVGIYSPMNPADGYVDPDDRELHIVAHSTVPDPNNFPPHTIWIHLNFESVEVKLAPEGAPI